MKISFRCAAFSFLELLLVIGIIGVCAGLLIPAIQNVRGSALRVQCQNNLHQIGIALQNYNDKTGTLPYIISHSPLIPGKSRLFSWRVDILAEMGEDPLLRVVHEAEKIEPLNVFLNPPHSGLNSVVKAYWCPADDRGPGPHIDPFGMSAGYATVVGVKDTMGQPFPVRFSNVLDGTGNTLMLGERPPPNSFLVGKWYSWLPRLDVTGIPRGIIHGPDEALRAEYGNIPVQEDPCHVGTYPFGPGRRDNPCDRFHFWSLHSGGANFAFCDGSVRFISYSGSKLLPALASRAGGETVEIP